MNTRKLAEISLIFAGITLFVFLLERFQNILRPLVIAIILSFLFTPFIRRSKAEKFKVMAKTIGSVFVFIAFFAVLGLFFVDGSSKLSQEENSMNKGFGNIYERITQSSIGQRLSLANVVRMEKVQEITGSFIGTFLSSTIAFISELSLIVLFLIFILPTHSLWMDQVCKGMKKKDQQKFLGLIHEIERGIKDYLQIKTVISLGTAIASFLVMSFFHVDHALIFAIVIFGLNYIPSIGSIIAVALVLIVELVMLRGWVSLISLAVLLTAIQMIFGNIIEPKVTGKKFDISPLVVILSLFFWGAIWGVGGMLFSVPLTLFIKIFLKSHNSTKEFAHYLA